MATYASNVTIKVNEAISLTAGGTSSTAATYTVPSGGYAVVTVYGEAGGSSTGSVYARLVIDGKIMYEATYTGVTGSKGPHYCGPGDTISLTSNGDAFDAAPTINCVGVCFVNS